MAHFEIDVTPDGLDNATLIGPDTDYMIPAESHADILIWNNSSVPVDVTLVSSHADCLFANEVQDHLDTYLLNEYRSQEIDNGTSLDVSFFTLRGLAPHSIHPLRITNINSSVARDWLDEDSCTMQTAGHGTNIHNGEDVFVIPFRILDA